MHQVKKSHLCLVQEIKLGVLAAMTHDLFKAQLLTETELDKRFMFKEIYDHHLFKAQEITQVIQQVLNIFADTYQRLLIKSEFLDTYKNMFPECTALLSKYEFVEFQRNNSKDKIVKWATRSANNLLNFQNYYIGPTLGTAFGAVCDIGPYLSGYSLGVTKKSLVLLIYGDLNIQHDLEDLFIRYKNIEVLDITKQTVTLRLLLDYFLSGGNCGLINDISGILYDRFCIESTDFHTSKDTRNERLQLSAQSLLEKAALVGCKKLALQASLMSQKSVTTFIDHCRHMKLVLITTRDDQWVGGGQPWRNTDIKTVIELIRRFLTEGFAVIRFNKVGESTALEHEFFLDFTNIQVGFSDQLLASSCCTLNIGAQTGATDIARQIFAKPTIYIEAPTLFQYGLCGWTALISKSLSLSMPVVWASKTRAERQKFLFQEIWNDENCKDFGLVLHSRSYAEIYKSILEAIHSLNTKQLLPTQADYCDIDTDSFCAPNVSVCTQTGSMLKKLMDFSSIDTKLI